MPKPGHPYNNRVAQGKDEWLTPPYILADLGPFDLDPCAPLNAPWPTAAYHYTIADDGLKNKWFGRVWLNPPYGRATGVWLDRMVEHGKGTALIFARTDSAFFFRTVWERATALLFLRSHLHFHHVTGERAAHNSGAPSVLVAYGMSDADVLAESDLGGKFVPLVIPRSLAVAALSHEPSWRDVVLSIMRSERGPVPLDKLYRMVAGHPKTRANTHWREKIRQTLKRGPFERVGDGIWQPA